MKIAQIIEKTSKDSTQAAETAMYDIRLDFSLRNENGWLFGFKDGSRLMCTPTEFKAQ